MAATPRLRQAAQRSQAELRRCNQSALAWGPAPSSVSNWRGLLRSLSIYLCIYLSISGHLHACMYIYRYICIHICICIHIYIDMYMRGHLPFIGMVSRVSKYLNMLFVIISAYVLYQSCSFKGLSEKTRRTVLGPL